MKFPRNLNSIYSNLGGDYDKTKEALEVMGFEVIDKDLKKRLKNVKIKEVAEDTRPIAAGEREAPDVKRSKLKGKRFVFTSAQNNTYVHEGFLNALESYCGDNDAQLCVTQFTYNKNGFRKSKDQVDELWYDPRIKEYLVNESSEITKDLVFCGELDISPTAVNPLSGFDNYCRGASGIIPHTKVAMQSLPGTKNDGSRFLYTTGALTQRNYIQRKAGQKADFHHVFGALVVEIDTKGNFHVRQLIADKNGAFYDLTNQYLPDSKIKRNQRVEAVNWGDIHIEKMDQEVLKASFNKGGLLDKLNPRYQFIHDLSDFTVRNHHNIKDPHFLAEQYFNNELDVEGGLSLAAKFLKTIGRKSTKTIVVDSNHDLAYKKWLKEADIHYDPANARFFHESNAELYRNIETGKIKFNIFEWVLRAKQKLQNTTFLQEDDSFVICEKTGGGIECGMHGHLGPNGSRGTPGSLRKIGRKVNSGHTHSATIIDGVYAAGVSAKLDMGYNKGPSSWSHSHIVTYPNGKRTMITIKDGKWRA